MTNTRQQQKTASRRRILDAASQRLREGGPDHVGIHAVMKDANLTHGAFYAHFQNKAELTTVAFEHAIQTIQPDWFALAEGETTFEGRLAKLAKHYLTRSHRDNCSRGCALAALASDLEVAPDDLKASYANAVSQTIDTIAEGYPERKNEAIEFLASIMGAINLARNVQDRTLSDQILAACLQRYANHS